MNHPDGRRPRTRARARTHTRTHAHRHAHATAHTHTHTRDSRRDMTSIRSTAGASSTPKQGCHVSLGPRRYLKPRRTFYALPSEPQPDRKHIYPSRVQWLGVMPCLISKSLPSRAKRYIHCRASPQARVEHGPHRSSAHSCMHNRGVYVGISRRAVI